MAKAHKKLWNQLLLCAAVMVSLYGLADLSSENWSRGVSLGARKAAITEVPKVACLVFAPSMSQSDCFKVVKTFTAPATVVFGHAHIAVSVVAFVRLDDHKRVDWLLNMTQHTIAY